MSLLLRDRITKEVLPSQFVNGFIYLNRFGAQQPNYGDAARSFQSVQNDIADYFLGFLNECGLGVARDYDSAVKLYKLAASTNLF